MEDGYPTAYNLGSGRCRWPGWINVDLNPDHADLCCDMRSLPVESNTADAVAAIHVLEHFYEWEAFDLLTEWKRILKPGGKLILELPCMDKVFAYVTRCILAREGMALFMTLHALYGDPGKRDPLMAHRWGYFRQPLIELLERVGMREITWLEPRYHFRFRDMRMECLK